MFRTGWWRCASTFPSSKKAAPGALLRRLQRMLPDAVRSSAADREPFYVVGLLPNRTHNEMFRPAESTQANTQGLPKWQVRLVHPRMRGTSLLGDTWTKEDAHNFYRGKYVEGSQVMALFNNRESFACTIEKVILYTPEQIQADAEARAEKEANENFFTRAYTAFFGTRIDSPKPLEPRHYDIRFFSPFRTWSDGDPQLLRRNVPQSWIVGGKPSHDFTVTETLRNIERFVKTSWPYPVNEAKIVVNGIKDWKQPKGKRKIFATEVFIEPDVHINIEIDGVRFPCFVLENVQAPYMTQFFERGKLWWV